MKRLIFDARVVGKTGHGISKYLEGVMASLNDADPLTQILLKKLKASRLSEVEVISLIRPDCPADSVVRKSEVTVLDQSPYSPKSWSSVPRALRNLKADLFFNPTFASYPSLPCAYVQTVHDLNHLHFAGVPHRIYYELLVKPSIRKAAQVLTVSEAMQTEIAEWVGMSSTQIKVIYNQFEKTQRFDADTVSRVLNGFSLKPKEYFFCVTNSKVHKNLPFLLRAHSAYLLGSLELNGPEQVWKNAFQENAKGGLFPLVVTVQPNELDVNIELSKVIATGGLDNESLGVLYQECAGFYFPSLYEGFGRPPAEAFLAGAPQVWVSDIPVHHEVEKLCGGTFGFLSV